MMTRRIQAGEEDQSPGVDHAIAVPEFTLPDASFLLYGTFSQDGFDLVITNPVSDKVTVADYFSFDIPPNLVLANGAGLTPAMVKSLFPRAFGDDVLFAGPAPSGAALTEIGTITLVVGNTGDRINLYGDFEAGEDRYAEIDGTPILFSEVSEDNVSLYFDQNTSVYVYENDAGVSIYGNSENDLLVGTENSETLSGRAGNDQLDAGGGADRQLGGDGNDHIKYDGLDSLIDGGRGVDTATITGNVDLSGVDNLENFEILNMSDNGTADTIELNLSDVLDIVGDNSLSGYEIESDNKVLVIKGDAEDTVLIDGPDLDLISPDDTDVDLFGDGDPLLQELVEVRQ
ncbi:MAG: hypothetical protein OSB45_14020, partial [Pseudomonadales bacterium]|nr:hypothetical protein [Pseudomonadales bacterium]